MMNIEQNKACFFTGHRDITQNEYIFLDKYMQDILLDHYSRGCRYFLCGGAVGFDQYAANEVIKLRKKLPQTKLILILPCKDQDKYFSDFQKKIYRNTLELADEIHYVSDKYYSGCMHKRNRELVMHSDYCICFLRKNSGGTKYTVDLALKKGCEITNIKTVMDEGEIYYGKN